MGWALTIRTETNSHISIWWLLSKLFFGWKRDGMRLRSLLFYSILFAASHRSIIQLCLTWLKLILFLFNQHSSLVVVGCCKFSTPQFMTWSFPPYSIIIYKYNKQTIQLFYLNYLGRNFTVNIIKILVSITKH